MNDAELDKLLKAAPVPERAAEFWAQLPRRISARLHWRQRQSDNFNLPSRPRAGVIWGWGFAGAAVLVLVGFLVGNWHGNQQVTGLLQNEKLLREVLATFPNQVQAIILDENGLHLSLAEEANVPQSQLLYIQVCDDKQCTSLVTFSGQEIRLAGHKVMVLSEARGRVILVGERFLWSSTESAETAGRLRIEAKELRINQFPSKT